MCMSRFRMIGLAGLAAIAATSASGQILTEVVEESTYEPGTVGSPLVADICQVAFEPAEPNNLCVGPFGGQTLNLMSDADCLIINGKLDNCGFPGPQPDTWLCVFDKEGDLIVSDDNGSELGNGKGSGLIIGDGNGDGMSDILVNNGDGTYSLRIGVTGFPDGFDGNCNGFFQNAPHGQMGEFTVYVEFISGIMEPTAIQNSDANGYDADVVAEGVAGEGSALPGIVIGSESYTDEFVTGAEAFRINFTAPVGSEIVRINIDNTTGHAEVCDDVDYMCVTGLDPLEQYCLTVVGGLDYDCNPTDTQLCWLNKDCEVIATDDDSGPAVGYSQLCVISDVNGTVCFAVSGGGDDDCDGWVLDDPHGVCGTYSIQVRRTADMLPPPPFAGCSVEEVESINFAELGDLNADGIVDGDDLSRLLSNWGVETTP